MREYGIEVAHWRWFQKGSLYFVRLKSKNPASLYAWNSSVRRPNSSMADADVEEDLVGLVIGALQFMNDFVIASD